MDLLLKKIKASTLVETMVAMTIISLVTGFSMVIFLQVSAPGSAVQPLLSAQQISGEMMDTLNVNWLKSEILKKEINHGNLNYITSTEKIKPSLIKVEIEVTDVGGKIIYSRKRLIHATD